MNSSEQGGRPAPLGWLVNVAKAAFYFALAALACTVGFLAFTNPGLNVPLQEHAVQREKASAEQVVAESHEWVHDSNSDVGTSEDRYPIVVLRTGFKVIRVGPERALVGWKYEFVNTSPTTRYVPTVTFKLQDADGFEIATGEGDTIVQAGSHETVTGVISVDNIDVERLARAGWTISLSPAWLGSELSTEGSRYTRLAILAPSVTPLWARLELESSDSTLVGAKWDALKLGLVEE